MTQLEQQNIAESLAVLAEAESAIGELYREFSRRWPEDAEFWDHIAAEEAHHARNIGQMAAIFSARPHQFQPGRPFKPAGIRYFIAGARAQAERARRGEMSKRVALASALDYERSGIEDKPVEIVRTEDPEYHALAREIMDETGGHKALMVQKMSELKD